MVNKVDSLKRGMRSNTGGELSSVKLRGKITATVQTINDRIKTLGSTRDVEAGRILGDLLARDGIDLTQGRLIEFGAGNGNFTRAFLAVNEDFTALEMNKESAPKDLVEKGAITLGDGIEALAGMPNNSVDTIVSIMFGPLIGKPYDGKAFDIERSLSEINRVLTPSGQFVVVSDLNTVSILEGDAYGHYEKLLKALAMGAKTTPLIGVVIRKKAKLANNISINEVLRARKMTYELLGKIALLGRSLSFQRERLSEATTEELRTLMIAEARANGCPVEYTVAYDVLGRRIKEEALLTTKPDESINLKKEFGLIKSFLNKILCSP